MVGLAAGAPAQAASTPVLVLSQPRVTAYAQVLAGFARAHRGVSEEVDVDDPAAASTLSAQSVEIVVAMGSKAFDLAKSNSGGATIVAAAVLGTVTGGRPDITAVPMETRAFDALSLLSALAPNVRRVVAFYPPGNEALLADAQAAVKAANLAVDFKLVGEVGSFQAQFDGALPGHDAVWVLPDARLARPELFELMATMCLDRKLPLIGFQEGMAAAGALGAVSVDYLAVGREAAQFALELSQRPKAERAAVPFRFAPGKAAVNGATLQALGLGGRPPAGAKVLR